MTKRLTISLLALCLLGGVGFALSSTHHLKKSVHPTPAIAVQVTQVKQQAVPQLLSSVGNLIAMQTVAISSEVAGRVMKIYYKDGAFVGKGMPIIQLDDAIAKASLASAKAALSLSQTTYERYLLVFKEGGTSQQQLDQFRSDVETQIAAVQTAEAALKQETLSAPFDGDLTVFKVNVGDFVNIGDPLVTLVNSRELKVEYSIPQKLLPQLEVGQKVDITSSAYQNQTFSGKVSYISPTVDQSTGTVTLQAIIPNKQELLSPGMFVQLQQELGLDKKALVIPEEAITGGLQGYTVFKVENGKALSVTVTLGARLNGSVQVLSGLSAGDTIVTAGQQKLTDGMTVSIVNTNEAAH